MTDVRVTWKPKTVAGWHWADTWSNEFALYAGEELTADEFDQYNEWTDGEVTGEVIDLRRAVSNAEEDELIIRLDRPLPCGLHTVSYGRLVIFGYDREDADEFPPPTELPHPALGEAWTAYEEAHRP